ncbi:pyridoxine 5'-phosphate synthase [bacterium BMS3Bbin14]|nr:pyridoxine 5'-phosphate synthase [bacterium BMS3Abin13]GBE53207.1 pyridoxine 5'-phosphate synthase [bacterium BMS3Bbin14]HDK43793.1 pyridoxine 5'-phosphate synthase [Desulfobacteraceae bacterium]
MSVNLSFTHDNETRPVSRDLLVKRAAWLLRRLDQADKDVSIVLMGDRDMASYNSRYRQRPGPTNVLSFPAGPPPGQPAIALTEHEIGDILISVDTAAREAQNNNTTLHDRITELMIHGLLHLLGYDHERSEEEAWVMWDKEQELFRELKCYRSSTMAQLAINIDHVATVRQARGGAEPDPVLAAGICELAGARGIVVHLREDRRHIQDRDVRILRQTVKTKLNLEMAAVKEIILIALDLKPDMITLVPEKRRELTTEGGLDVIANENKVRKTIDKMSRAAIPVSLFIDPDMEQIKAAKDVGATFVELHTGRYCDAGTEQERDREFNLIAESAETAKGAGLRVNAGHGLDYRNTARIAALDAIEELSIGHAVISRAVQVGLDQAVREMLALVRPPFPAH